MKSIFDLKDTFSSTVSLIFASGFEKIFAFLIIPLLTNNLTQSDYGELILSYTYASIISIFIYNGLQSAFFRWYSLWDSNLNKNTYEYLIILILLFIAITFLLVLSLFFFLFEINPFNTDENLLILVLIANFLHIPYSIKLGSWILNNKSYYNIIFLLLKGALTYLLILLFIDTYQTPLIRPGSEIIILAVISLPIFYELYNKSRNISFQNLILFKPIIKKSFFYGWENQITQTSLIFLALSDRIIIEKILGNEQLAIFSIGVTALVLIAVIEAFNSSYSARYNSLYSNKKSFSFIENEQINFILLGLIFFNILKFFLNIFSEDLILLLSNTDYLAATKLVSLPSDLLFFYFVFYIISRYFHATIKIKKIIPHTILAAIFNIFLTIYFVDKFGILGAIFSTGIILMLLSLTISIILISNTSKSLKLFLLIFGCFSFQIIINYYLYDTW